MYKKVYILHRLLAVIIVVCLLLPLTYQPVLAVDDKSHSFNEQLYDLYCEDGICQLAFDLGRLDDQLSPLARTGASFLLETVQANLQILPNGTEISLTDHVEIKLPLGDLALVDADLIVERGSDNRIERLHGTANLPIPTFGLWDESPVSIPSIAHVGLDWGQNLTYLGLPLELERRYIFFHLGSTSTLESPQEVGDTITYRTRMPRGHGATIVVDLVEPQAFLAGHLTIRTDEAVSWVSQWVDPEGAWIPDGLPLQERLTLYASSGIGNSLDELYLQVGGKYAISTGAIGHWLGIDVTPAAVEGLLTLDNKGLMLNGGAGSSLQPSQFFDGMLQAQIFVPFSEPLSSSNITLMSDIDVPFIAWATNNATQFDLATVWPTRDSAVAMVTRPEAVHVEDGAIWMRSMAGFNQFVSTATNGTVNQVRDLYHVVSGASLQSYDWVVGSTLGWVGK